ncbi:DUF4062 domain-containing protein [Agitococcus lubricus]|uniref:Uncharacterized protein DUF4062 n=1 Tax=Agitococcus lubricus TaxID=1077255 RepID=A0A2T5IZP9_9GAMM|nr:DUF4062 domain-containing protein [Agitococcus lubricus]PTQ89421.1 uncharacterized protein DUF4062 [Agitococcus lubricus]
MTDKRYQVFISATYTDLREERGVLLQTLPSLGCLPTTLEAHTQSLSTMVNIRRRIDDSDYYILLLGSRYGSLMPSGVSYTHMEYVYAATKQKPILILMHEAPETRANDLQEQNVEGKLKFGDFRKLLLRERENIVYWRDSRDLAHVLHNAVPNFIRKYPATGWVRIGSTSSLGQLEKECENLRKRVQELEQEREKWLASTAVSTENLSKGEELFEVQYRCKAYAGGNCQDVYVKTRLSWNELLVSFGPHLLQAQTEDFMAAKINERLQKNALTEVQADYPKTHAVVEVQITPMCFSTIKMQFRTLGFISKVVKDNDQRLWWQLSALGERNLANVMSVRRSSSRPVV